MRRLRLTWRRFGELNPVWVVGGIYAIVILARVLFPNSGWTTVAGAALVVLILYCCAKRRSGFDVFLTGAIPGGVSGLFHDLFGTPHWLGLVLVPVALLLIASDERAREKA